MRRPHWILVGALLCIALLTPPGIPQDGTPKGAAPTTNEEKLIQAILTVKAPHQAADGYEMLFRLAGADGLGRLRMHASDTIAIQAAWEEVELTLPEQSDQVVRPDRDKLAKFLGFLEGRARVRIPKWWSEAVLDARANQRGNVNAAGLLERREQKPDVPQPPPQASFEKQDGKQIVRVGTVKVRLPEDFNEKLRPDWPFHNISAQVTSSCCYIAVYNDVGRPYNLTCVERSSGKILWITKVWASWWGLGSGRHRQWVEVTEQGNRVVVFGIATTGFHVEAFRTEDGSNVFRFSNSYSGG